MISYSDYVLAERPWAYWPLNDPSNFAVYNENQYLIDVSGNNRHLTARHAGEINYQAAFAQDNPTFPSDSLPVRGLRILGSTQHYGANVSESNGYAFLETGTNAHINDVEREIYYGVTHQLFRRRVRGEFLFGLPVPPASPQSSCGISSYPLLSIGGMTFWMNSVYIRLCDNCSCSLMYSYLTLTYPVQVLLYDITGRVYSSYSYPHVVWASGYLIAVDPQLVCTGIGRCFMATEANGTGFLTRNRRFIFECEYFSDTQMFFRVMRDGSYFAQQMITFPTNITYESGHLITKSFLYTSYYTDVALICSPAVISNLSIYYDKEIDSSYLGRSWNALNTTYVPGLSEDITEISDNLFTNINQGYIPNSTAMQLDSLLIRGISHKRFSSIEVEEIDDGYKVTLFAGDTQNELFTKNYWVPDFKIGDIISLDGSIQDGLNGCWRVEELVFNGVVFTTNTPFVNEGGHFIVKRAPIGGGAWVRGAAFNYHSSQSELGNAMTVNDSSKTTTTISIPGRSVKWRRMMKRDSSHYLGEDMDYGTAHWTILGDHLRFVLVMAYKQNPKPHSRILTFGDFNDPNDNQLKTMLIGYINDQMGDVGFNKIFEYFEPIFSDKGVLHLTLRSHQPSGIGWIYSNQIGELDYLHGTKDCGQHRYPIPSPLS